MWQGSVGSEEEKDVEQQHKVEWAWKRQENALEAAREKTRNGVIVEHIDRKDVGFP